jgi:bifunctional oligoribonuclease and PAP phosphatase NrnA
VHAKIRQKISEYKSIIITSHVHPDGDAMGSVFGLAELIRTEFPGTSVHCTGELKASMIGRLAMDEVEAQTFSHALVIVIDTANTPRIAEERWESGAYIIKIDHHPLQDTFGDLVWVDTAYASCCEMVADLMREWGGSTTKLGAELILHGIITDTGRFRYPSVTSRTLLCAAKLLSYGVDLQTIYAELYTESLEETRFRGFILENFEIRKGLVAYMKFPSAIFQQMGVKPRAALRSVNLLSTIAGVATWVFFVEEEENIRVELRSNGPAVNTVAARFGGGGHDKAAGARIESWAIADEMISDLYETSNRWKESNSIVQ